ncbi:MAG: GNAT family N-acetyltransferase [Erythrobacter sp.]
MPSRLRDFRDQDAPALGHITREAIRVIGPHAYSLEQVEAWSARHTDERSFLKRDQAGATIIVATDERDEAVAYTLIEPDGHLDMLYCHPAYSGKGIANELLSAAENLAQSNDVTRLYTEASELARPAFERAGYTVRHRRDFEIQGVSIHNYAMEKQLI